MSDQRPPADAPQDPEAPSRADATADRNLEDVAGTEGRQAESTQAVPAQDTTPADPTGSLRPAPLGTGSSAEGEDETQGTSDGAGPGPRAAAERTGTSPDASIPPASGDSEAGASSTDAEPPPGQEALVSLQTEATDADSQKHSAAQESSGRRSKALAALVAKRVAQVALLLLVLGALAVFLVIRHYEAGLPSVAELKAGYDPPQVTRVLARDGTLLANLFTERRTVIGITEIPDHVKLAFLAAEDAHFYEHEGLNYFGMLRALIANLRAGKTVQGGSTITQQVVKNLALDAERSYRRKIRETILARRVEQNLTKDEIFSLYLNQIYFGHGRYGIEEAARYYFGKRTKELSLSEAALLAGLVAAPERFSPRHAPERALGRRHYVLHQMLLKRFVTEALFRQANEAPLRLAPAVELEAELSPEIVTHAQKVLQKLVGDRARRGGYVVRTTIDPRLQALARRAVRENLDRYAKRRKLLPPYTAKSRRLWGRSFEGQPKRHKIYVGTVVALNDRLGTIDVKVGDVVSRVFLNQEERYNPQRLPPSEFARVGAALRVSVQQTPPEGEGPPPARLELGPQSALVAVDVRTREVRALIGSYEALAGGLDRATRARRQPGSAFKPFVYGYALHSRRFAPATVLELPDSKAEEGVRRISVREAIARSDNAAAEYLLEAAGAAHVVQWARAAGIESDLAPTRSLALGAYEVTPLEITNAYATFASGGSYAPPILISKIVGPEHREVPLPPRPPARRVMDPDEAYLVTSLLQGVVQSGTGQRARSLGRPLAGKTGTTNQAKDAWFVGYSTELVVAVWVGYDDALPLGAREQGAVTALPAWVDFMKAAHEKRPPTAFARPSSVLLAKVDPATGQLPYEGQEDSVEEEFLRGTIPTEMATPDAGVDAEPDAEADAGPQEDASTVAGQPQGDAEVQPAVPADPAPPPRGDAGQTPAEPPDEPPPF